MPSWSQILYVILLWGALSLCGSVATQLLKTPIRVLWKRKAALRGDSLALYNWMIRSIPIVACTLVSTLAGAWPEYITSVWTVILGSTSGLFSVGVYHGIRGVIPKLLDVLPEALRKRLGG